MTIFNNAIVRQPAKSMHDGLTEAGLGLPNYDLACEQHLDYVLALKECGLDVIELPAIEAFPDSCFVEDVALLTEHCAILMHPGAVSRRGEVAHIEQAISDYYDSVLHITAPGLVEAGDIMMVGSHFYIGLSERTNQEGAQQVIAQLEQNGMTGSVIEMTEVLHLKTGLSYIENNRLLACGEFVKKAEFAQFDIIEIEPKDAYSANCIWVNDTVLVPKGFASTSKAIADKGYRVREVAMSEFQKLDGGLSCLSLRF